MTDHLPLTLTETAVDIRAIYGPPPIHSRNFDWSAINRNTYDGAEDSPTRSQIGYGHTEAAAITDLMEQINAG